MSGRRPDDEIEPGQPWGLEPPHPPGRGEPTKGGRRRRFPPIWLLLLLVLAMLIAMLAVMLGAGQ